MSATPRFFPHITTGLIVIGILALQALLLHFMGRIAWCACGIGLWTSSAWSSATSQLFADPYSASHVLHGIIFYLALWYLLRRLPLHWRLIIALLIEVGWEILENSPIIINRYRAATASLDYFGDSILNSVGDSIFMLFGFWLAYKLPWRVTLVLSIAIELIMLALYRDNLTLNVLMLLYPFQAVKQWQMVH